MTAKKKRVLASGIVLVILAVTVPAGVFLVKQRQDIEKRAAPATSLSFIPDALEKSPGDEFALSMEIDTGENMVSVADVTVTYNADVFELLSLRQGDFFSGSPIPPTIEPGLARFIYGTGANELKGPEATGMVATLFFKVKDEISEGVTEKVAIEPKPISKVAASEGNEAINVLASAGSSEITVMVAGATVTPTPTGTLPPGATVTPKPTGTLGPTATPTPETGCWEACTSDSDCSGDLVCESISGTYRCVNENCITDEDCVCSGATPTVGPTATSTPVSVSEATATPATSAAVPVTGLGAPALLMAIGSGLLLVLGFMVLMI